MSTTVAPATVRRWWQTITDHRPPGRGKPCPICKVRRCWPRASAFGELVAYGEWDKGPR